MLRRAIARKMPMPATGRISLRAGLDFLIFRSLLLCDRPAGERRNQKHRAPSVRRDGCQP
jgi:hypothetical protein